MSDPIKKHMLVPGSVSWTELMTTDVKGAQEFYGKIFDWTFEEENSEEMDYVLVKNSQGTTVAGIVGTPPEAGETPPHWASYITVKDVHAVAKMVPELGGTILLPPTEVPNIGTFAVIQDPQGAVISVFTYVEE